MAKFVIFFQKWHFRLENENFLEFKPTYIIFFCVGVREMCDDCQTSIFNYHFICLFCGHITCITCGEKHFTFKSMTGVSTKTKRNISCKSCSETERFRKSDEKPRDCMLPISLIPIDAIHHLYEILKYVMKVRFISSVDFRILWYLSRILKILSDILVQWFAKNWHILKNVSIFGVSIFSVPIFDWFSLHFLVQNWYF